MPVTGETGYINAQHPKVLQIFPYLLIALPVAYPVKLGITNIMIVIQYQTKIIGKVGGIDQQMSSVFASDRHFRCLGQIMPEQALDTALRQAAVPYQIFINLPLADPFLKPDKLVL